MDKKILPNYLRNTKTSRGRTVRLEVIGGVNENEKHFLNGVAWFAAAALAQTSTRNVVYISRVMSKMVNDIVKRFKSGVPPTDQELEIPKDDKPGEGEAHG